MTILRFFAGYATLDRSVKRARRRARIADNTSDAPLSSRQNILDLGCGYGWFCRYARDNQAASVMGLDISQKC